MFLRSKTARRGAMRLPETPKMSRRKLFAICAGSIFAIVAFSQAAGTQRGLALDRLTLSPFLDPEHALQDIRISRSTAGLIKLDNPAEARSQALQSLTHSPINPGALLVLSVAAASSGETERSVELALLGERLSRRHSGIQVLRMQSELLDGQLDAAMTHVDLLLKVDPTLAAEIFPVLSQSVTNDEFREVLTHSFREGVEWRDDFLFYAASDPKLAVPVANLILDMEEVPASDMMRQANMLLTTELVRHGDVRLLRQLISRNADVPERYLADGLQGGFLALGDHAPLSWSVPTDANFGSVVAPNSSKDALSVQAWANPGYSGSATEKLLWLKPGKYQLSWTRQDSLADADAKANWRYRCAGSDETDEERASGDLFSNRGGESFDIIVRPGCEAILLTLAITGSSGQSPAELNLANVALSRKSAR